MSMDVGCRFWRAAVGTRSITTILLNFNTENMDYKNTPPPLPIQIRGDLAPLKKRTKTEKGFVTL